MKRLALIVLLMAASLFKMSAGQVDSTSRVRLSEMLEQYYEAMLFIDNSEKEQECDFLIESCKDSLVRQFVASSILEHYMNPPLMGEESVAIYLYEKWFLNGPVTIGDEWKAFEASMFYQFNRLSMIDMPAPSLELYDPNGEKCAALIEGSPAVLYFYDTSCAKCKLASAWLPVVMGTVDFPIRLVAIYSGSEEEEWSDFRSKFKIENENVSIIHLWDPEMESDYQMKYGITSTPKIYFIDENCIIRGRRLERDSLEQILNIYKEYYGQVCKKEK